MLTDEQIMSNVPFIYDAFNYYNGRINLFPVYKFEVCMLRTPRPEAAITKLPGIVTVFPFAFKYIDASVEYFRYFILECIIHELHHVDQNIRYDIVRAKDDNYIDMIESNVEFLTCSYMISNATDIYNRFGVDVRKYIDVNNYLQEVSRPMLYQRKTYAQHIENTIYDMCNMCDIEQIEDANKIKIIINNMKRMDDRIITVLELNGEKLELNNRFGLVDINIFNDFVYRLCYKYNDYNMSVYYRMEDLESTIILVIGIKMESITTMVDYALCREV